MSVADRSSEREAKHLDWRVRLFGAGAVLAVLGMYYDSAWVIWLAFAILGSGLFLRFLPLGKKDEGDD